MQIFPFSKSKFNIKSLTLLQRLVLSIELGTVQTGTGKVDPARKFKCTTAAREVWEKKTYPVHIRFIFGLLNSSSI